MVKRRFQIRLRRKQRGFTYLFVLIAVAVLGVGLLAESEVWTANSQRQKLVELDWIGHQFVEAIGSYYQNTPGIAKSYPGSLEDLLDDRRLGITRRHLRVVYRNPFSGRTDWELIAGSDGKIHGIKVEYSSGPDIKTRVFTYVPPSS